MHGFSTCKKDLQQKTNVGGYNPNLEKIKRLAQDMQDSLKSNS